MIVVIDFTAARSGGGIAYARGLLKGLSSVDPENQYRIYICNDQVDLRLDLPGNFTFQILSLGNNHLVSRMLWQQLVLPVALHRCEADVVFLPTELALLFSTVPSVSLFQNWLPFVEDEEIRKMGSPRGWPWKKRLQYVLAKMAAKKSNMVLFVSEASRCAISGKLGLPSDRTGVVHHGIEWEGMRERSDKPVQELPPFPFILAVGDILAHKNHKTLAAAYALLVQQHGIPHHLVLVGRDWSRGITEELQQIFKSFGLADRVTFLGSVPFDQMPSIYERASLLVLPSYVETFGFPALEAMSMGVPVAATRHSAIPEICGDSAVYFDPWRAEEMADAMLEVLSSPEKAATMGRRGYERSLRLDWTNAARMTLDIFIKAAGEGKRG